MEEAKAQKKIQETQKKTSSIQTAQDRNKELAAKKEKDQKKANAKLEKLKQSNQAFKQQNTMARNQAAQIAKQKTLTQVSEFKTQETVSGLFSHLILIKFSKRNSK